METDSTTTRRVVYDDGIVRAFSLATIVWGVVSLLVGVIIALQLSYWQANLGVEWLSFGRLRALHTNAAIFAFVGNMMFAGVYYSTQRLLRTRMASGKLSWINFWGYQLIIILAAITLPLGLTQSKEYAELIWPIDVLVVIVWVVFALNFFWTLAVRNERNLYVAIWFYIASIVTIAVLYIVNNLALPTSFLHSYPIYAGVQDALVQWWYGHNAVAFFLTTPMLGIMYYYVPKSVGRPVYSYRLSVVHFWSLVFLYIWAGPHHLLYTALPGWAQSLGMVFSIMLWAPSWGGMLNGLLTLRGAWDRLRTDPVCKFFAVAVTFYGMSTFEGPLLSIKSVSALGHYTDWIIGHVHGGTLGWNGFLTVGMLYWMVPKLWGTKLYSTKLADLHFWIGTLGILLYVTSMWVGGINQGLGLLALDESGYLKYPDFIETLIGERVMYQTRLVGGVLYFASFLIGTYNLIMTIRSGKKVTSEVTVTGKLAPDARFNWKVMFGAPVVYCTVITILAVVMGGFGPLGAAVSLGGLVVVTVAALLGLGIYSGEHDRRWHSRLQGNYGAFTILTLLAILVGGVVEIIPTIVIANKAPVTMTTLADGSPNPYLQQPYSPLELEGRDLYVREGCYVCHSQMIRPFRAETLRYGDYSRLEESIYDHPFLWGSKRTGPDLARVGGRYGNMWHYLHMKDPRNTSPGSNMPTYAFMEDRKVDLDGTAHKMETLSKLGVPYTDDDFASAVENATEQGRAIAADLAAQQVTVAADSELVAMIAYLQRLGRGPQPVQIAPTTGGQ